MSHNDKKTILENAFFPTNVIFLVINSSFKY